MWVRALLYPPVISAMNESSVIRIDPCRWRRQREQVGNHVYVFCQSAEALTFDDVGRLVLASALRKNVAGVEPNGRAASEHDWQELALKLQGVNRPVIVTRSRDPQTMAAVLDDARSMLHDYWRAGAYPDIERRLDACRQMFHIELSFDLSRAIRETLDSVEGQLAARLDGIIFSAQGFYDKDHVPICCWD